jgi:hypothetical protein
MSLRALRSAFLYILCGSAVLLGQSGAPRVLPHPDPEIDLAAAPDPAWSSLDSKPHASFVSTSGIFERHRVPAVEQETHSWSGIAWRGERVHAQVLVWSREPLKQLRVETVPLAGGAGRIPAEALTVRFVRYVLSERAAGSQTVNCEEIDQKNVYPVPDLLDPVPRLDLPGSSARPVWITIDVPRAAQPGAYSGTAQVKAEGGVSIALRLDLEVQAGTVPAPADWQFRVDFWQNPWAVAYQHRVTPWSDAHIAILRRHLRYLADIGQTYVSAYITDSPWKDDTFIPDGNMVEWVRERDGTFSFDYRIFDLYVELAMSCGIDDAICCFTLLPWNGRVRYLDRASGEYRWESWKTDSPEYERFWRAFLRDLRAHLVKRKWFEKTYLEVNERSLEDTLRAARVARADSPDWKLTYAGGYHAEFSEIIDDLCTIIDSETPAPEVQRRRTRGQTSTFYVCCGPPFPNNFPFSPTAENVWMGWHAAAAGLDGFLRWAWDSWPSDPLRDTRHFRFPAGDTFLVYPGPHASIRMERLREGFVDYEKIRIVRARLATRSDEKAKAASGKLERAIAAFSWERVRTTKASTVTEDVRAAQAALASAASEAWAR